MSCAWPSRRSSTEKLSNQVMMPWSFTPLTRNMVTGVLVRRSVLRNMSWRLLTLSAILFLPDPAPEDGKSQYHAGGREATPANPCWRDGEIAGLSPLIPLAPRVAEAERLQLAVQRRALHADEIGGPRDIARET